MLGLQDIKQDPSCTNGTNSTVGAGDTFLAGMMYGLLCHAHDWTDERKMAFAVRLATLKVQREGFSGLGKDVLPHP